MSDRERIRSVFDKVVEYKRKQFSYDYPSASHGKKVIRSQTIYICHVLFPEIWDSVLSKTITECMDRLQKGYSNE